MTTPRRTSQRDRLRKAVRERQEPCHICGQPIDYTTPHLDPGEFVVDHVIPLNKGGDDALHNAAAAHRACNRAKSDHLLPNNNTNNTSPPPTPVIASNIW